MDYTKRAKIVKNLKFELRPVGKTMDTIRERGFLEADETLREKHKAVYPLFDAYVKSVVADAFLKEGGKITAELIAKEKDLESKIHPSEKDDQLFKELFSCISDQIFEYDGSEKRREKREEYLKDHIFE